jgi:hypothetical protein
MSFLHHFGRRDAVFVLSGPPMEETHQADKGHRTGREAPPQNGPNLAK